MSDYTVVSARIPVELKKELERFGIKVSEVIRRALLEEVRRRKIEEIRRRKRRLRIFLERIPDERVVQSIRELREER